MKDLGAICLGASLAVVPITQLPSEKADDSTRSSYFERPFSQETTDFFGKLLRFEYGGQNIEEMSRKYVDSEGSNKLELIRALDSFYAQEKVEGAFHIRDSKFFFQITNLV